ncbi:MAG: aminotransferase class IV [Nitrospiria bacterium]
MPNIAFVNGTWSRLSEARISIEDRGLQFGDGVYEVIRTYGKEVFGLREHLARLKKSADAVEIPIPYASARLEKIIRLGCLKCRFADAVVYLQLTRGSARRNHAFPKRARPTLVITFRPAGRIPKKDRENGVSAVSLPDIRWGNCHIKSLNLLPNVMAREQAIRSGAFEAILVRNGEVTEGSGSNLFSVFGKKVVTSPPGSYILSGITRDIVLRVGKYEGLEMLEKTIRIQDLYKADELFLTGTTVEVLPVVRLDDKIIGPGKPGDTTRLIHKAFLEYVHQRRRNE